MIGGPLVGGFITDHLGLALDLLHQPAARRGRAGHGQHRAAPAARSGPAPDRLPRRRAADRRHHLAGAAHHLGRHAVRLGLRQIIGLGMLGVVALAALSSSSSRGPRSRCCRCTSSATATSRCLRIGFLVGFVMFGAMMFLPLYQQTVQGASATNSGLLLLPMLLGDAGRLARRRPGHHRDRPVQGLPDRRRRLDDRRPVPAVQMDRAHHAGSPPASTWPCSARAWAS